jgi:hypothetical protein
MESIRNPTLFEMEKLDKAAELISQQKVDRYVSSVSHGPSRSEATVKGDHRESRQRACPLTAARAEGSFAAVNLLQLNHGKTGDFLMSKSPNGITTPLLCCSPSSFPASIAVSFVYGYTVRAFSSSSRKD